MAKRVQISADDITYYTLPGNAAELRNETGELNDTIFGQDFASSESGLISWTVSANALYKGFAGYVVSLKKSGATTVFTALPATLVTGKTYALNDVTKQIWDTNVPLVVKDGATDVTAQVESADYLFGTVTFKSTYTVVGAITIGGSFFPVVAMAGSKSFTLTQTADTIDTTDIPTAQANGGYKTFDEGLKTATLELSGIYKVANGFQASLNNRDNVIVEINPDGSALSVARGMFTYMSRGQSGDVGALEEETVSLSLAIPDIQTLRTPFAWKHSVSSKLNQGVQILLNAWLSNTKVWVKYLPDGLTGFKGQAVPTDLSLAGGLEVMNEFTVNLQGSGAPTVV